MAVISIDARLYLEVANIIEHGVDTDDQEPEHVSAREIDKKDEAEEVRVIVVADAVIDPGTVMIHFQDAAATYATMMGPGRFIGVARLAETWACDSLCASLLARGYHVLVGHLLDPCDKYKIAHN